MRRDATRPTRCAWFRRLGRIAEERRAADVDEDVVVGHVHDGAREVLGRPCPGAFVEDLLPGRAAEPAGSGDSRPAARTMAVVEAACRQL